MKNNNYLDLAKNLSYLIKIHKLSIDKLAVLLNMPPMTIRRIITGETTDPRISTLQAIANYFNISLDVLLSNPEQSLLLENNFNQYNVPVIYWKDIIEYINSNFETSTIKKIQQVTMPKHENYSNLFAIESKPYMNYIYPQGTIFVITTEITPIDGDMILVKFIETNEISLRKLQIDPPELYFHQISNNKDIIKYNQNNHSIIGIVVLTLLYNHHNII